MRTLNRSVLMLILATLGMAAFVPAARAVPSYTRQTGLTCAACHTLYPALTPFGRQFKLNGYTMTGLTQVMAKETRQAPGLSLNREMPISAIVQVGLTSLDRAAPGQQNPSSAFPQSLSLYLAGAATPHVGTFIELGYDQDSGKVAVGMVDVRYANHVNWGGTESVYGVTFNNTPTLEDVWNSTPAYGYPFVASASAPTPAAGPFISSMNVASNVLGVGGYSKRGDWYGDVSFYRSAPQGQPVGTLDMSISGTAPYLRLAWSRDTAAHSVEFGVFGLRADYRPMGTSPMMDRYTDLGVDGQYQYFAPDGLNILELHGSYIREKTVWGATTTSNPSDVTHFLSANGSWIYARRYGVILGYFQTVGATDCLLYNGNTDCVGTVVAVSGSRTGSPNSRGYTIEFDYLPWQNLKLATQYTLYRKFNGAAGNYDGNGRNAADNNTFYVNVMLSF